MGSLSLGDCVEIAKSAYKIYKFFHDAPEEIKSAGDTLKETIVLLGGYEDPKTHPPYLKAPEGKDLAELISGQIVVLRKTLIELKRLLKQGKIAFQNPLRRMVFIAWHVNDIKQLQQALDRQNVSIDRHFRRANDAGVSLHPATMNELLAQFEEIKQKLDAYEKKKSTQIDEKLIEDSFKLSYKTASSLDQSEPQERARIRDGLSEAGISPGDADAMIDTYHRELSRAKVPKSSDPGLDALQKAHKASKGPSRPTVLFVDKSNGALAVMAHLYAELIRVWSHNNGHRWLFRRAAAAGWMVQSRFRAGAGKLSKEEVLEPGGQSVPDTWLDLLFYDKDDFRSNDSPNEKEAIMQRVRCRGKQGLPVEMVNYSYIICFDEETRQTLTQLHKLALTQLPSLHKPTSSAIVLIQNCEVKHEEDLVKIARPLRDGLKEFFVTQMGWKRPSQSLTGGKSRTQFIQIKHLWQKDLLMGEDGLGLDKFGHQSGCKLHIAYDSRAYGWVVSITGKREVLPSVVSRINEALHDE